MLKNRTICLSSPSQPEDPCADDVVVIGEEAGNRTDILKPEYPGNPGPDHTVHSVRTLRPAAPFLTQYIVQHTDIRQWADVAKAAYTEPEQGAAPAPVFDQIF